MISLFDCVATLAEVLGSRLRKQEVIDVLMPLLSRKWQQLPDSDKRLLPLFECFQMVIHAIGGDLIHAHLLPIFERCTRILQGVLQTVRADPKDGWNLSTPIFLRSSELISTILMTLSEEQAA